MNCILKCFGAAFCLSLAMMMGGCSMSDDIECPPESGGGGESAKVYVKVHIAVPSNVQGTRAGEDPAGGEEGDGREDGQDYENFISSALVFFYRADKGVNADDSTPIDEFVRMDVSQLTREGVVQVPLMLDTPYNVLVVANPGDISWASGVDGQTLGGVRNHIYRQAWKDESGEYTDFVMSSEDGSEIITVTEENTSEDNAKSITVDVERLAARVDYQTNQENNYTCDDNSGSVKITGAAILNQLTAGTYLIKRVTADGNIDGEQVYLGDELPAGNGGGMATNYVIDPWTSLKNAGNADLTKTPFTVDEKQVSAKGLYAGERYYPDETDDPETWAKYCKPGDPMEGESAGWSRVGYMLENTTAVECTSTAYNTGIVFKAEFTPTGVGGYKNGQTFFRYNTTIYTTLTGMMSAIYGQEDFPGYVESKIEGCESWDDVDKFADVLAANNSDPTGYADYLKDLVAKGGDDFNRDNIYTWDEYMTNVLGVDESNASTDGPQINIDGKNTRNILFANSGGRIQTYYKSQCYYVWWLRHSNNGDEETNGIMEYAVVRNNIYKVTVNSVYSIGGDIPGVEELRAHVYVNKWVGLEPETLPM